MAEFDYSKEWLLTESSPELGPDSATYPVLPPLTMGCCLSPLFVSLRPCRGWMFSRILFGGY